MSIKIINSLSIYKLKMQNVFKAVICRRGEKHLQINCSKLLFDLIYVWKILQFIINIICNTLCIIKIIMIIVYWPYVVTFNTVLTKIIIINLYTYFFSNL